jgi:hypothetical protein
MSPDSVSSKTGFQTSAAELDRTCRRNARIVYSLEALRRVVIFCLAQFLFRHDALVRLNKLLILYDVDRLLPAARLLSRICRARRRA